MPSSASHRSLRSASLAALLSLLFAPVHALAARVDDEPASTAIVAEAGGLHLRFERSAIEVRSASRAPEHASVPWHYALESYGRGSAEQRVLPAFARRSGEVVSYQRGTVIETYELREDGVKQSFLFAERPAGPGDLVVRGRVRTSLALAFASDQGLRFEREGCAGIALGAVVGIDGSGRTCTGAIGFRDGVLEYRLPAAFVDGARFPLLVDPLIGSSSVLLRSSWDDRIASVSVRGDSTEWLSCWKGSDLSSGMDYVYGQRFSSTGAPVGGLFTFVAGTGLLEPAVARVAGRDINLVVWRQTNETFYHRAVTGDSLSPLTAEIMPSVAPERLSRPALGGEALAGVGDRALLVWSQHDPSTSITGIFGRTLQVRSDLSSGGLIAGNRLAFDLLPAAVSLSSAAPSISRSGGEVGRWLIVWIEGITTNLLAQRIRGRFYHRSGTVDGPAFTIYSAAPLSTVNEAKVDGDGVDFLVAFPEGGSSIRALPVRWTPRGASVGVSVLLDSTLTSPAVHSVAWTGSSVLIGAEGNDFVSTRIARLYSVDPYTGLSCESGPTLVGATQSEGVAVGARFDGVNTSSREAFVVWSGDSGASYDLHHQRFRVESGLVQDLGGSCASGGTALVSCSRSPATALHFLRLHGAAPSSTAYLALSRDALGISCGGGCQLLADPFDGFAIGVLTDALGDAALNVPIGPGLVGQRFVFQWISPGASCFGGFDLSNALRVTIQ